MNKYNKLEELKLNPSEIEIPSIREEDNKVINELNNLLDEAIEKAEKYEVIKALVNKQEVLPYQTIQKIKEITND